MSSVKRARRSVARAESRALRGCAKATNALEQHLAEHRRERVEALRRTGAIAWSGRRLHAAKPVGKVRGNKTVADLVVENRE
jgi:hypothetical protein